MDACALEWCKLCITPAGECVLRGDWQPREVGGVRGGVVVVDEVGFAHQTKPTVEEGIVFVVWLVVAVAVESGQVLDVWSGSAEEREDGQVVYVEAEEESVVWDVAGGIETTQGVNGFGFEESVIDDPTIVIIIGMIE